LVPLLWLGEDKRPLTRNRKSDFVMDSAYSYYRDKNPRLAYQPKKLFLDNGSYTAIRQGVMLDPERVLEVQEALMPDLTIPLDFPFSGGLQRSQMAKRWKKTQDNIKFWQGSTKLRRRLVPSLHSWDKSSLESNVKWLQKHADSDFVALGSIVNDSFHSFSGFFGDRAPSVDLVDMLLLAIKTVQENSDFKAHLMGFGSSPLTMHLGYYMGAGSVDSAGSRRKAAYGKIILPGTGERYVGNSTASFGNEPNLFDGKRPEDIALWERCGCPICVVNKDQILVDWKARAIHNEFVMKEERRIAELMMAAGLPAYEAYLDNRVFARSSLRYLWEYAKRRRKFLRISEVLLR
jgi:7-cyano-7-deazaguanine tRNA-ribosyltransferase